MDDMERSEQVFREFIRRLKSGEKVQPEEYYKKYPGLEDELRKRFEQLGDTTEFSEAQAEGGHPPDTIGEFHLIREIGRGGMGVVYEAEQLSLKRKVALKILPTHLSFSDEAVNKFRREAEAGGRQSHPGIVAVHAVGHHEGYHYIAQELVEGGGTLADKLDELRKAGEQPTGYFREVAQLISDIADALHHAHESGVIHRDIKPSNILLTGEGNPKVTDFGLAKVEDALALSRSGDFAGTPYYMSPEQAMSRRIGIDRRTDIYSLGVTLYEALTQKRPFEGKTSHEVLKKIMLIDPVDPHKANARVPRDLGTICLKAMEKLPEKRFQSMEALADDLQRFLSGDAILAKPVGSVGRSLKRLKRNPLLSGAVGVALVAVLALVVLIPWFIFNLNEEKKLAEKERKAALEAKDEADLQRKIAEKEKKSAMAERDAKEQQLLISEGHRLAVHSSMELPRNPHLALLLAIESAERNPGRIANRALLDALKVCRACETLVFGGRRSDRITIDISSDGERLLTMSDDGLQIWNAASVEEILQIDPNSDRHGRIYGAKFSPDGKKVWIKHKNTGRIWDTESGKETATFIGHSDKGIIQQVEFSSDGKKIATSSSDGTLRIWDAGSGKALSKIQLLTGFENFDLSPDGSKIVMRHLLGTTVVLKTENGKPVIFLDAHLVNDVAFSPDGTKVVTRSNDNQFAQLFDIVRREEIFRYGGPGKEIYRVKFSPDGAMIAVISWGGIVKLLNPDSGREIYTIGGTEHAVHEVNFSSDMTRIVTASKDGTFQIWDADSGKELAAFHGQRGEHTDARFCSGHSKLVTISHDDDYLFVNIWTTSPHTNHGIITLSGHEGAIWDADFSLDGEKIITISMDNTARVWDARTGMLMTAIKENGDPSNTYFRIAEFDPNSEKVLTVMGGSIARIWDPESGKKIVEFDVETAPLCNAAFSPDGSKVVTGATDATVHVWDIKTGEAVLTLGRLQAQGDDQKEGGFFQSLKSIFSEEPGPPSRFLEPLRINLPKYSPDGSKIVTGEVDGSFKVYDASTGEILAHIEGHNLVGHALSGNHADGAQDYVTDAIFTYDGCKVVTVAHWAEIKHVRLWDATTGKEILFFYEDFRQIKCAALSPDSKRLLGIRTYGRTARIWDLESGNELVEFRGHDGFLLDARFSPDGKQVVTASSDRTARIWDAATGKELLVLRGQECGFSRVVFSPDGERILTASDDGTVMIWPVDPLKAAKRLKSRELTPGERAEYIGENQKRDH